MSVKGWTSSRKLGVLVDLLDKTEKLDGDILEIGSAWGRSTVLLGLSSEKAIWSIDPHTGGVAFMREGNRQRSFEEFQVNLQRHGLAERVQILKYTTQEVAQRGLMAESRLAFVFIDGLHTAEGVKVDFDFAYEHAVASAILAFDDYFEESVKDYSEMIDSIVKDRGLTLNHDRRSKLVWLVKP